MPLDGVRNPVGVGGKSSPKIHPESFTSSVSVGPRSIVKLQVANCELHYG